MTNIESQTMTKERAFTFLRGQGWNEAGAEAIIDALIRDHMLNDITIEQLKRLSDDYKDR